MKNNNWTLIIAILVIFVLIYLLFDFNKSIEPFSNKRTELENLLTSSDDKLEGLNDYLELLDNKLNTTVRTIDASELTNKQKELFNKELDKLHTDIYKYDFTLGTNFNTLKDDIKKIDDNMRERNLKEKLIKNYKGIKSQNNGLEISLQPVDEDSINTYLIKVNSGCLGINSNKDGYDIYACNPKNESQHFNLKHIFNEYGYIENAKNPTDIDLNVKYPFVMAKSVLNDNCISNFHNNLSVIPCNNKKSQRWNTLDKDICKTSNTN